MITPPNGSSETIGMKPCPGRRAKERIDADPLGYAGAQILVAEILAGTKVRRDRKRHRPRWRLPVPVPAECRRIRKSRRRSRRGLNMSRPRGGTGSKTGARRANGWSFQVPRIFGDMKIDFIPIETQRQSPGVFVTEGNAGDSFNPQCRNLGTVLFDIPPSAMTGTDESRAIGRR